MIKKTKVLITGAAGFVGFHLSKSLLKNNFDVVAIDNLNDYYSVSLKKTRLEILLQHSACFCKIDITNLEELQQCFIKEEPDLVVHLAAQAGVRYSLDNPSSYIQNNLIGFFNILEVCKFSKIDKLIFASSSSVYGNLEKDKFDENDKVDNPLNLYSASKKSNELMAYAYANLYHLPCVGLRFFTVYGPWGRPDMAYFKFTKNIINNVPIEVYGKGKMYRDFTYIDDVIEAIYELIILKNERLFPKESFFELFNIGNDNPVQLNSFINIIEESIGKKAIKNFLNIQPGDVEKTSANLDKIKSKINFLPKTNIEVGIPKFVDWYKNYHQIS